MIHKKTNIKVTIAAREYILRLGIISLIRHLGFEPEYIETDDLNLIDASQNHSHNYLIVHHKLLESPKPKSLQQLETKFFGAIMVIGNEKTDPNFHQHLLLPSYSEKEIIDCFQTFFDTFIIDESQTENNILSLREIDVLKEVALGYSNKEIADRLFISINTVITHRKNITEKLGIKTISGLTVYAIMNNLIDANNVTF